MTSARCRGPALLVMTLAAVLLANAGWFAWGEPLERESALRIVCGGMLISFLPGLALGELIGLASTHVLETAALSFVLSLAVEIALLAVVMLCGADITIWVLLLLTVSSLLVAALAWRVKRHGPLRFLRPLLSAGHGSPAQRAVSAAMTMGPLLLAVVAYGWGEAPLDLGGEKLLHLSFIRLYRELPLVLENLGIDRGLPPPNLVHLWEFLLAGWSRLVQVDPLPLFHRARFVVPLVGFSGMYLLVKSIFAWRGRTAQVFLGVMLACVSALVLGGPSLAWITATDPTRGVFAFLGTSHHADTAIDMLIAVTAATALLLFRRPGWRTVLLFATMLTANFLWHPREFFQLALYVGIFAPLIVVTPALWRPRYLARWGLVLGTMVVCAGLYASLSAALVGKESHGYDERVIKQRAVEYALMPENLLGVRNLFNLPFHLMVAEFGSNRMLPWSEVRQTTLDNGWLFDGWLMLSAAAAGVLGLLGGRRDVRLATYYLLLWLLALCWNATMLVILALTYSEFFMSTPRLLYLFAYLVIADAGVLLAERVVGWITRFVRRPWLAAIVTGGLLALAGYGFSAWQQAGVPAAHAISIALCTMLPLAILKGTIRPRSSPDGFASAWVALAAAAFCVPLLWRTWSEGWRADKYVARPEIAWFSADNPLGVSTALIDWARSIEPGCKILVDPTRNDFLSLYAPQYLAISPVSSVVRDLPEREAAKAGKHPLFPPPQMPGDPLPVVDHQRVHAWLTEAGVEYMVVAGWRYQGVMPGYYRGHTEDYEILIDRPPEQVLVVRFRPRGARRSQVGLAIRNVNSDPLPVPVNR